MHPIAASANAVLARVLNDLAETTNGLPDEALDWAPAPGQNSIAVLVRHSLAATPFLWGWAAGIPADRRAYFEGERATAFRTAGVTAAALTAAIDSARAELAAILERVTDQTLAAKAAWDWPDGGTPDGGELLIHAIGHLREHTAHAGLTRDLWLAAHKA